MINKNNNKQHLNPCSSSENNKSSAPLSKDLEHKRKGDIVPLRPKVRRKKYKVEARKRPIVRNKDGVVIWQADPRKFYYRAEQTGKFRVCSWLINGGNAVVVKDGDGNVVEAYKIRDGETVETISNT